MNYRLVDRERSSREIVLFAVAGVGLLLSLVGVIVNSVFTAIGGLVLLAMALGGFFIRQWLEG